MLSTWTLTSRPLAGGFTVRPQERPSPLASASASADQAVVPTRPESPTPASISYKAHINVCKTLGDRRHVVTQMFTGCFWKALL